MTNLVQSIPKYLPEEWEASNRINFKDAEQQRAAAESLRDEAKRLRKETHTATIKTQESTGHKLTQRIRDIDFWKQELGKKINENTEENGKLVLDKKRLEDAITDTNFPLMVANECLQFRAQREKIDLVHDAVEVQLIKEVEMIEGVQALLQKTHDQAVEQIRLLRSVKYYLEKDLTEKLVALSLDGTCAYLTDHSEDLSFSQKQVKIQTNSITPDQWASFTDDNIVKTEKQCNASSTLRGLVLSTLDQTTQDVERQRVTVNLAFAKKIMETIHAKKVLENQLEKVLAEVISMEGNIAELETAVQDKSGPLKLAHTRLEIRSKRPNKELVRDPVQYGLTKEVKEITDSIHYLQEMATESRKALKDLVRNQLTLEEDIAIKVKSLHVDQDLCMGLRAQLGTKK